MCTWVRHLVVRFVYPDKKLTSKIFGTDWEINFVTDWEINK